MKKPILILEQQSWSGGAQRVLEAVLSSIKEDFHPVVAFPEHGPFSAVLRERGIETCTFPFGTYRPGRKSYSEMVAFAIRSLLCAVRIAITIHRKRIALVYINGPRCLPAGVLAAGLMGRPSLFHLHLMLTRRPEVFVIRHSARYVSRIVACSRAAAESVLNADPGLASKVEILYNPVIEQSSGVTLPALQRPGVAGPGHVTVGIVGRITEAKGHRLLLNAVMRLRPEIRNQIRLIIVGAPGNGCLEDLRYARSLQESAMGNGLQEKILWTGHQQHLDGYYGVMDVLVQPSLAEAMPLAVLEALQRGIPVIASRTGGIPEIVRHGFNGLLNEPDNEDDLVLSLERFVEDQSLRERLRMGAMASIDERFSQATFKGTIRDIVCHLSGSDSNKAGAAQKELSAWK